MNVLLFAPHQDDESFSSAGTLARHRNAGDPVTIVFMTDGRFGDNPFTEGKYTPDQLASKRKLEALNAAREMGVNATNVHFLGYHDQDLGNPVHHDAIIEKLLAFLSGSPSIVYVAMTNYGHVDHLAMYFLVFEALDLASYTGEVRVSIPQKFLARPNQNSKNPVLRDQFARVEKAFPVTTTIDVDISSTIKNKFNAIKAHETQMGMFANLVAPDDDFDAVMEDIFNDVYEARVESFEVRRAPQR